MTWTNTFYMILPNLLQVYETSLFNTKFKKAVDVFFVFFCFFSNCDFNIKEFSSFFLKFRNKFQIYLKN